MLLHTPFTIILNVEITAGSAGIGDFLAEFYLLLFDGILEKINCRSISKDSYLNESPVLLYREGAYLIEVSL